MQGILSRLIRQSGLYALLNLALKLSGLLVVPLYLNLLTEEAFGHFALLDATARIAILVADFGITNGLLRFMTSDEYADRRRVLPFTAFATTTTVAVGLFGFFWVTAPVVAEVLVDSPDRAVLVRLMALYAAFKVIEAIPMMLMRTQERVGLYVTATLAEMLVLIAGVFAFLVWLDRGLQGIMEAYAVSAGVGMAVLGAGMLARIRWRYDAALLGPLVRFGAPMVLAGLASLFMNIGDRYLLKALTDAATVGVYDWAARLAGVLNMLFVNSFQLAFGVLGLKVLSTTAEGVSVYRRIFRHYVIWTGWSVLGLSLLAYDFTALVSDKEAYLAADMLVLPLALGFMAFGVYYIMVNVLFKGGRTGTIAGTVFGAAILNAVLNVVLIPVLGALGSALATTAAYACLMALTAYAARRQMAVDYAWAKLGIVVLLVVGLYLAGLPAAAWPVGPRLGVRVLLILAYLPLIVATRLYTPDEVRLGLRYLTDRWAVGRRAG